MKRIRGLLVGICAFSLLAGGVALADGPTGGEASGERVTTSARGPSLKVPRSLSIGKKLVLRARGFPPKTKVFFGAQLDGPAALSGRSLGRVRTNKFGRATLRKRFPRTYKWCDASRKCYVYKWPKRARIALTAGTKDGSGYVRKVRRLK